MSNIICSISRGHNASTTLMIDGKVIFYLEEERLSRFKRDGTPLLGMAKVYEYVDHIDHLVVCHTHRGAPTVDWTTEDLYKSWMRKLCKRKHGYKVTFIDSIHHEMHSDIAFINSGFDSAASVIADGAGSFLNIEAFDNTIYEFESIYHVKKGLNTKTVYKHYGTDEPCGYMLLDADNPDIILTEFPGIVKEYEAITRYCGFNSIEAGKTMGLSPYGQPNPDIPPMFVNGFGNRNLFKPNYPNGAYVVEDRYKIIRDDYHAHNGEVDTGEYTQVQKDLAYAIQKESEDQMCALIQKAHEKTGETNIVICGGYGLNCVANYKFKQRFPNLNIYVEPISHDGGTSMGGAYHVYYNDYVRPGLETNLVEPPKTIYYGPQYDPDTYLDYIHEYPSAKVTDASYDSVARLIREGNIVTIFQGRSEAGPRALGNRSILFDPTIKDGKDIVNKVKRREFFRPFACSILAETVHDWFDLAGMDESPSMMYAVDALPGVDEKIPSVIHVDGTCRIQTVTKEQNEHYYNLISAFEKLSNVPILFNTSFNLGGDPLVEDIDDALDTLSTSDINYMYLPEIQKLVEIKTREMQDTRQQPVNILTETADTKL
tara:strand:- start:24 stop:1820 length:1797 start_codon:yes stop_codon:yes gene_type:complete